jgi:homoserine kinase
MDTLLMRPGRKRHPERMVPLTLYAPASIGNFSLGFDSLGLALAPVDGTLLGDLVQLSLPEYALPWPASWRAVVCWPGTEFLTREARAILPDQLPRATAVRHGAQFAQFVHALYTGNSRLAAASIIDHIAEPDRRRLLPGFDEACVELRELGALAVGISGSGPAIFALVDDFGVALETEAWLAANYKKNEQGFVHICRADLGGSRIVE